MPKTQCNDVFARVTAELLDDDGPESETEPETQDEAGSATSSDGDGASSRTAAARSPLLRHRRAVAALVAGVVVAALGSCGFLGWRLHQVSATAAAGRAALEAAKNYAVVLTTLDAKNIDSNYTAALDGATGEFKDSYSLGSAQLRQILIDNNAAGKGIVVDAAVKSATKTKVDILLFVDQSITNAVRSDPRIDRNRIQMTMELVDNRWLASRVDLA